MMEMLIETPSYQNRRKIEMEMAYLIAEAKKTIEAREKLYSMGVIYGKYRDYIAVSSFYDYLMAGRCDTLEGASGAYNLFEEESRAELIIGKLDTIIRSLDTIKKNQYFIYSEIQKANSSLEKIQGQLLVNNNLQVEQIKKLDKIMTNTEQMAISLEEIAENTEVSAYYAKQTKELTDALGFMLALK